MLYGQVLQSRMDKLFENISQERLWWMHGFARKVVKACESDSAPNCNWLHCVQEFSAQKVGSVEGDCSECKNSKRGWLDPDVEEFFCEECCDHTSFESNDIIKHKTSLAKLK